MKHGHRLQKIFLNFKHLAHPHKRTVYIHVRLFVYHHNMGIEAPRERFKKIWMGKNAITHIACTISTIYI